MNGQAKAGGERGINGEWYDGGQFLPSSKSTVKGAQKATISKGTKREIAPYVWDKSPDDDMLSIYDSIASFCHDNRSECQFVKGSGFVGFRFTGAIPTERIKTDKYTPDFQDWVYIEREISGERKAWLEGLIERFNNGERWMPLKDHKYHYKNIEA